MTDTPQNCVRRPGSLWTSCKCEPCRLATCRLQKLRRSGHAWPVTRSTEAWAAIDRMLEAGWSAAAIATAGGFSPATVQRQLSCRRGGQIRTWRRVTAEKIIAAESNLLNATAGRVDATGTVRRLRALAALGWSVSALAQAAADEGLTPPPLRTLYGVRQGAHRWVPPATARFVRDAYDVLSMRIPPVGSGRTMAIKHAAEFGWLPPLAYDDGDLDKLGDSETPVKVSPKRDPDLDEIAIARRCGGDLKVELTVEERREAVRRLHANGMADGEIAAQVGMAAETVFRLRKRLGLPSNFEPGQNSPRRDRSNARAEQTIKWGSAYPDVTPRQKVG